MRNWSRTKSGRMIPWYSRKNYKKSRFRKMEMRAAKWCRKMFPEDGSIPGFNDDLTRQVPYWE